MLAFTPSGEIDTITADGCRAKLWFPAVGMVATRIEGYVTGQVARELYAIVDARPQLPFEGFLDLAGVTGFDWDARARALRWNLKHRSDRMRLHLSVSSPAIRIGARIFELALGDHVEVHATPAAFASAYGLALKRRSRVAP